jgi:hypothetical protein
MEENRTKLSLEESEAGEFILRKLRQVAQTNSSVFRRWK